MIEEGVQSIPNGAFFGCYNLQTVVVPDSVTSIGISAFSSCTNLKSIRLPAKFSPGSSMLAAIRDLDIYYAGSNSQWQQLVTEPYWLPSDTYRVHYNCE